MRVNTLRFDGPGDVPRLRRGSIAPFAKYPPSLERHYYLPSVSGPLYSCDRAATYSTMIASANTGQTLSSLHGDHG